MESDEILNAVCGYMRKRRVELGMSQQALGKKVGVTFQQIQKYEKGMNTPNVIRLFDIAEQLGMTITEFVANAFDHKVNQNNDNASERQVLEMVKRFKEMAHPEQAAMVAFMKTLSAERKNHGN